MKDTDHGRDKAGSGFGKDGFDCCVQNELKELQTRGRETTAKRQLQLSAGPKEGRTMAEQMEGKERL